MLNGLAERKVVLLSQQYNKENLTDTSSISSGHRITRSVCTNLEKKVHLQLTLRFLFELQIRREKKRTER